MKMRILAVLLVLASGLHCCAQTAGVDGEWQGIKNTPERVVFTGAITLQSGASCKTCAATGDGSIEGKIVWGLRSAGTNTASGMASKVGRIGTEYVKGQMKGKGLLVLNGYKLDDPEHILVLDKYRLAVSDDGKVIGGLSFNNGHWTGQFIAIRPQK
ncbi:MAG: hypothetical protein ACLQLH_04325 [Terracidiphilus sp.]|jgi:hypothetical protein